MGEDGAPEKIRTSDLQLRRLPLYPAELRAHASSLAETHLPATLAIKPLPDRSTIAAMKTLARCCTLALAFAAISTLPVRAQADGKPLLSPAAMADASIDGAKITIHYNSPAMRGRVIMGGLVPYGQVWRTGANPATSFVTTGDLKIGALTVPAGSYTIYTLPAAPGTPWLLIVNKQTGQWGTEYKPDMDLGRTPLHHEKLPAPQESMTISFDHTTPHSTELHIKWETTDESIRIESAK
jgi:hypothetical protein